VARVALGEVDFYTQPHRETDLWVRARRRHTRVGRFTVAHGIVEVADRVTAYKKKSIRDGSVLGHETLDLPSRTFETQAFWVTGPDGLMDQAGVGHLDQPGTLHAAEHTAIAMLPLFAICDRWDVGGLSIAYHPQLGEPAFFIYDGYEGGAGIAPIAFGAAERHLRATLATLDECPCRDGCPSCVQSPKCGNFNEPLDKHGAAGLLRTGLELAR
jgi:DEAD/DEAH box helicase domain-containing protein